MNTIIELRNIEIFEFCKFNLMTGEKKFYRDYSEFQHFIGDYFRNSEVFFALYSSPSGPIINYKDREYKLSKELHIDLERMGDWRIFSIEEYDIHIKYHTSPYIGFDAWSEEDDVDLFYQIQKSYKDDDYYKKYIKE